MDFQSAAVRGAGSAWSAVAARTRQRSAAFEIMEGSGNVITVPTREKQFY